MGHVQDLDLIEDNEGSEHVSRTQVVLCIMDTHIDVTDNHRLVNDHV